MEEVKKEDSPKEIKEQTTPVVEAQKTESPPTETPEQINWKKFREQREIERKEKIEADKRAAAREAEATALKAAMEALLNKPSPQTVQPQQIEESEEDRINRMVSEAINKQRAKDEDERKERERKEYPSRLMQSHPDFNQICSTENLDYIDYHYPEVSKALQHMPDGFDKWDSIYKAVKRFVPNTDSKKDQRKAESNYNKPQAMSVPGRTQTGDSAPHQLDEKRRAENWARMQRAMKGVKNV